MSSFLDHDLVEDSVAVAVFLGSDIELIEQGQPEVVERSFFLDDVIVSHLDARGSTRDEGRAVVERMARADVASVNEAQDRRDWSRRLPWSS